MEIDALRELKEKIVKFVTHCINVNISKMNIVIDYDGCQYETEHFVRNEPNKTPQKKCGHGTYKLINPPQEIE